MLGQCSIHLSFLETFAMKEKEHGASADVQGIGDEDDLDEDDLPERKGCQGFGPEQQTFFAHLMVSVNKGE
jgi:hypothetical protein